MGDFGWAIGIGILVICATLGRSLAAVLRAHANRIERSRPEGEAGDSQLGETVAELQKRVGELEERVDFAERMLSQQREAERVAPPKKV